MHVDSCYSRHWIACPTWLQGIHKQFSLCAPGGLQVMVSEPLCSREGTSLTQVKKCWSADKEILGKSLWDCNSYLINLFPNPYLPFSSHKKVGLRWDDKMIFRVHNLPCSQITGIWIKCPWRFDPRLYLLVLSNFLFSSSFPQAMALFWDFAKERGLRHHLTF